MVAVMYDASKETMKSAAVIVTYNPDNTFIANIKAIAAECDNVCVVDNSWPTKPEDCFAEMAEMKNVIVLPLEENQGIAYALNLGVNTLGEQGYENIFLFDQDSSISQDFIENMLAFKQTVADNTIVCSPIIYDRNLNTFLRTCIFRKWGWDVLSGEEQKKHTTPLYVTTTITSGSLLSYRLYKELGEFRDDYFIDMVDSEYCIRANLSKYKVAMNCQQALSHSIGKGKANELLSRNINILNHAPIRKYYIARNKVSLGKYCVFKLPSFSFFLLRSMIIDLAKILLFEKNKFKKITSSMIGYIHGLFNKMGPCRNKFIMG